MSDYNKITDYSAKDALSSGDAAKRVKGSELGADFDAVAVAVATKANSASPVFTGVSSFAVGAVGAPSIYMTGYATTGWYNIGANNWGFAVSGAKVLDVSSTGLAVTGETFVNCSSAQGTEKFRADVASGSTEVARITCGDGGYASNMLVMNAARVANASFSFQGGYANSVVQYTILGNGNMQNVNNSYGATSDAKLKENITDATPKLADLLKVRIRNYNLKSDSSNKQIGVIAQELETIFPALVEETQDKDEAGVLLGTTTKAVKYSVFVPMLIKALQELNAKFEAYVESHP